MGRLHLIKIIATVLASIFVLPIVVLGVETFAERRGFNTYIADNLEAAMSAVSSLTQYHTVWLAAGFFIGVAGALWLHQVLRGHIDVPKDETDSPLKLIDGANFRNERVIVDGMYFQRCTFDSVTFVYNGGPFTFNASCKHCNSKLLFTTNKQVDRTLNLVKVLGIDYTTMDAKLVQSDKDAAGAKHK